MLLPLLLLQAKVFDGIPGYTYGSQYASGSNEAAWGPTPSRLGSDGVLRLTRQAGALRGYIQVSGPVRLPC
jgi:hypothetical protein